MTGARLSTLLAWRVRTDVRALRRAGWAQKVVASLFVALAIAFILLAYRGFHFAFETILVTEPHVGPVLVRYILELCFLTVLFLGTVSFVVASVPMLFRTKDPAFVAGLPVSPEAFFAYRFLGALTLSSWPVFLLVMPALVALGVVLGAGVSYAFLALSVVAMFLLNMGLAAAVLSFGFAALVRQLPATLLHFLELAGFFALAIAGARTFVSREIFTTVQAETAASALAATGELRRLFARVPSHYPVETLTSVLPYGGSGGDGLLVLAVSSILLSVLLAVIVRRSYLPLLQRYREGSFIAKADDTADETMARTSFPRVFRWRHGFLFEKDLLTFLRNPEEVSRAGFLLALLALYVLAISGLSHLQAFENVRLFALAVTFFFAATGYFALTLGLRFAFPSLSLEGKSAWVLWSSPVHAHEFFSWKFFFWSVIVSATMQAVSWTGSALFGLPVELTAFLAFAVLCASVSLIAVTLGQGSIFPDFRDRPPDVLTTTPAGLAAAAVGLAYLYVVGSYVHRFAFGLLSGGRADLIEAFGIVIVSLAVITTYWTLARRRMDRLEVA